MQFRSIESHCATKYHDCDYANVTDPLDMCYRLSNPCDKNSSIIESSSENSDDDDDDDDNNDSDNTGDDEAGNDVDVTHQPTIIDVFDQIVEKQEFKINLMTNEQILF